MPWMPIKRDFIIHQLFPVKAMCLMSASDNNLFIFFGGVTPIHLIHLITPIPSALNAASLERGYSHAGTGQQDNIQFRRSSQQMRRDAKEYVGTEGLSCCLSTCGRSLFASGPDHIPARTYCRLSPAWELAKDPVPRLALLDVRKRWSLGLTTGCACSYSNGPARLR